MGLILSKLLLITYYIDLNNYFIYINLMFLSSILKSCIEIIFPFF